MGKLAVYKYVSFMFLVASAILTVFTLAALFGGQVTPAGNNALAMLVYALPFLLLCNVFILLYWLIRRRWKWAIMPTFALLCCVPYVGTFYQPPLLSHADNTMSGLVVATYNVAAYGKETSGFKSGDILAEMMKNEVDVLCIQEYKEQSGDRLNTDRYKDWFPYHAFGRDDIIIFSRYPILKSEAINFGDTNNSAMWADINVAGATMRVFNAHLETTGFNRTMKRVEKMEKEGIVIKENAIIKAIYGNYTMGMITRARQSRLVADMIASSPYPVVLCGDFNDVPYSYTYHTMRGDLVDGFRECGSGFMSTYRGRKKFRIDYIFHDKRFKGLQYYKQDLTYSDHDPVFMKIAL
ncbi:MAG: endonuclease/exonuclease/phosphatase family protein [Prevotella sp.]|nr:endonuclease/exonuclease/phosphatase family protein [Prevotella sp.]